MVRRFGENDLSDSADRPKNNSNKPTELQELFFEAMQRMQIAEVCSRLVIQLTSRNTRKGSNQMSLAIEVEEVTAVLLADGWHKATRFDLDSYEYMESGRCIHGGGSQGVCATGATWVEIDEAKPAKPGYRVYAPLTAILAVRTRATK